jgi:ethanolamine ammonia-lyase large subunit
MPRFDVDQQTCEARAYAVTRRYAPLLVNAVVGSIGPEYLFGRKQIIRAGLENHFCGKLLGLPMGGDVCYTPKLTRTTWIRYSRCWALRA